MSDKLYWIAGAMESSATHAAGAGCAAAGPTKVLLFQIVSEHSQRAPQTR